MVSSQWFRVVSCMVCVISWISIAANQTDNLIHEITRTRNKTTRNHSLLTTDY